MSIKDYRIRYCGESITYTEQIVTHLKLHPFQTADQIADDLWDQTWDASSSRKRNWERINYAMEKGAVARIELPVTMFSGTPYSKAKFRYYVPKTTGGSSK